jgi:hypothetical protein
MMSLIDNDQIKIEFVTLLDATYESRNAGDLNTIVRDPLPCGDAPVFDAMAFRRGCNLVEDLDAVRHDKDALSHSRVSGHDVAKDDCLSAAGRQHKQNALHACPERFPDCTNAGHLKFVKDEGSEISVEFPQAAPPLRLRGPVM